MNSITPASNYSDSIYFAELLKQKIVLQVTSDRKKIFFIAREVLYIRSDKGSKYIILSGPSFYSNGKLGPRIIKLSRWTFSELGDLFCGSELIRVHDKFAIYTPLFSLENYDLRYYSALIKETRRSLKKGIKPKVKEQIVFKKELVPSLEHNSAHLNWDLSKPIPLSNTYMSLERFFRLLSTAKTLPRRTKSIQTSELQIDWL